MEQKQLTEADKRDYPELLDKTIDWSNPDLDEVDNFDDLEGLLAESVSFRDKMRAANRRSPIDGLGFVDITFIHHFKTLFSCAIVIRTTCSHCGSAVANFSHFADYQEFTMKAAGKPCQWKRVAERPTVLAPPRIIEKQQPACLNCLDLGKAVAFGDCQEQKQLSLLEMMK